jgi:hypothetical protein
MTICDGNDAVSSDVLFRLLQQSGGPDIAGQAAERPFFAFRPETVAHRGQK